MPTLNQSINQSIDQSINQSINQSTSKITHKQYTKKYLLEQIPIFQTPCKNRQTTQGLAPFCFVLFFYQNILFFFLSVFCQLFQTAFTGFFSFSPVFTDRPSLFYHCIWQVPLRVRQPFILIINSIFTSAIWCCFADVHN